MSNTQYLKFRDTRPIITPTLRNPDGSVFDLTGTTQWFLHVHLMTSQSPLVVPGNLFFTEPSGVVVTRPMTILGLPTEGKLAYTPVSADWDANDPDGAFIRGIHRMEYEVLAGGDSRGTFPNGGYDLLVIGSDLGQG